MKFFRALPHFPLLQTKPQPAVYRAVYFPWQQMWKTGPRTSKDQRSCSGAMAYLGDQRLVLRTWGRSTRRARRERGRGGGGGGWESGKESWRGEEEGQARGQAGLAGPDCAARSWVFSLVEFPPAPPHPPRQFKCFLITLPSHIRLWPFTQWKVRTEKII